MKRWLFIPLLLLVCAACMTPAFAEPGDLAAAHMQQQFVAPDSGDALTTAIAPVVSAVAPLLPAPYGGMAMALLPLIGIFTNVWYRWRGKSIEENREKRRKQLLVDGIAYAEELSAAAKKTGNAMTGPATLQAAVSYVRDRSAGNSKLFAGVDDIREQVTAFLGRIPGVGATGNAVV